MFRDMDIFVVIDFKVLDKNNNYSANRKNDGTGCVFFIADDGIECRK